MEELIAGFRRFRTTTFLEHEERFGRLAERGQAPRALVVACCDSRVDPQMIFDAKPGELFVIRNVANLVPPYQPTAEYHGTSAALEFGVCGLRVDHLVVLGHAQCGGIGALISAERRAGEFIGPWMEIAAGVREHVCGASGDDAQRRGELEGIRISLGNLLSFPFIRQRVEAGTLALHGLFYDFPAGALLRFDAASGAFGPVDGAP